MTKAIIYNCRGHFTDLAWLAARRMRIDEGLTEEDIASKLGVNQSTINRHIKFKTPPSERKGRKRQPNRELEERRAKVAKIALAVKKVVGDKGVSGRAQAAEITKAKFPSALSIGQELARLTASKLLSESTIRRDLRSRDIISRVLRKGPMHKAGDKKARVAFAKRMLRQKVSDIIFTDEKIANTNYHGAHKGWKRRGTAGNHKHNAGTFAPRIHVWGAVGIGYRNLVEMNDGSITSLKYSHNCVYPTVRDLKAKGINYRWQHDNARVHTAAEARMGKYGVNMLGRWPARSPDLSPIETIWALVQRKVDARCCTSQASLRRAWKEEFANMPQSEIDAVVGTFRRRCQACVALGGGVVRLQRRTKAQLAAEAKKAAVQAAKAGKKRR